MKICFFGVGGVGGYFGSLMVNKLGKKHDIYFVARGKHMEAIQENGLLLKKSGGDEEIIAHPTICTDSVKELPICDVIILSVKSYDLENASKEILKISDKNTVILPLLNGVDISSRLRRHLPDSNILQSCVYVGTHIESPGVIFQKGGSCNIHIGWEKPDFDVKPLLDLLEKSEISFQWEENVNSSIWNKYMFIAAFGLVTASHNKNLGEVINDPKLSSLTKNIMAEIEQIAKALNVPLDSDVVETSFNKASNFPPEARTSFQRDVESKGNIHEGDLFGGTLIRFGKSLGIPTPNIESAYINI